MSNVEFQRLIDPPKNEQQLRKIIERQNIPDYRIGRHDNALWFASQNDKVVLCQIEKSGPECFSTVVFWFRVGVPDESITGMDSKVYMQH